LNRGQYSCSNSSEKFIFNYLESRKLIDVQYQNYTDNHFINVLISVTQLIPTKLNDFNVPLIHLIYLV